MIAGLLGSARGMSRRNLEMLRYTAWRSEHSECLAQCVRTAWAAQHSLPAAIEAATIDAQRREADLLRVYPERSRGLAHCLHDRLVHQRAVAVSLGEMHARGVPVLLDRMADVILAEDWQAEEELATVIVR